MKRILLLTVVALAVGVLAPTVHAGLFTLTLNDGINPALTITDGGAGDGNPLVGAITYSGAVGANWVANVTTGLSKPFIGTADEAVLHLNSVDVTSINGGTLTITLRDDGYSLVPAPSGGAAMLKSEVSVTTGGTAEFSQTWKDGDSSDVQTLTHGPFTNGSFAETLTASVPYSGPFSLTELAVITHVGSAITSFDFQSTVVPVPAAVLLGLLGLSAAGLKLRRFA